MKALKLHNKQTSLLDHSAVYLLPTVMVLWWVKWTTDVHLLNCSSSKTLKTTDEQKGAIHSSHFSIRQKPFICI